MYVIGAKYISFRSGPEIVPEMPTGIERDYLIRTKSG